MNHLKLCIVILITFFLSNNLTALCVKAKTANLRAGPSTRSEKTWEVYQYTPLKKVGYKNNWYKVEDVDGDSHWIYASLVTDNYYCAVVKTAKATVRLKPRISKSTFIAIVEKYYSFKYLARKGKWAKVEDEDGNVFWIYRSLIWVH